MLCQKSQFNGKKGYVFYPRYHISNNCALRLSEKIHFICRNERLFCTYESASFCVHICYFLQPLSSKYCHQTEDIARHSCKVQLEVLYLIQAIPNQFCNFLPILYHFDNLPWV